WSGRPSAVRQKIFLDIVAVGLEQHGGAAQLADLLLGALDHAVALARLGIEDLSGRRHLEALLGARLGLDLGHLALLMVARPPPYPPPQTGRVGREHAGDALANGVLNEHFAAATAALISRAAGGRGYGRGRRFWQPAGVSPRRQNHHHLAALEARLLLDLGDLCGIAFDAVEQLIAELLVRHFAAAEAQRHLDLVAFPEKALHRAHLHVVIVIVDHRPQLDLLDLDDLLLLARLGGFLLRLIFVFAVIQDLADRRDRIRRDLHKIEPGLLRHGDSSADLSDALVGAIFVDELDLADADLLVNARTLLGGGLRGSDRATNGSYLLKSLQRAFRTQARITMDIDPRC